MEGSLSNSNSIRKVVSMNNLSQYEQPPHDPNADVASGYAYDGGVVHSSIGHRERRRGISWTEEQHKPFLQGLHESLLRDFREDSKIDLVPVFYNLDEESGLKELDEYLLTRSYITGYQASMDDITIFEALSGPPSDSYVNVHRWYTHIYALLRMPSDVFGEGQGVTITISAPKEAIATPPIADTEGVTITISAPEEAIVTPPVADTEGVTITISASEEAIATPPIANTEMLSEISEVDDQTPDEPPVVFAGIVLYKLKPKQSLDSKEALITTIVLTLFLLGFSISSEPHGWLSSSFPLKTKHVGVIIYGCLYMLTTGLMTQFSPSMICYFRGMIFFYFAVAIIFMGSFIYGFIPNTENIKEDQFITEVWKKHWFWRRCVPDQN